MCVYGVKRKNNFDVFTLYVCLCIIVILYINYKWIYFSYNYLFIYLQYYIFQKILLKIDVLNEFFEYMKINKNSKFRKN